MEDNSTKINIKKVELHVHVCIPEGISLKKVEKAMNNVLEEQRENLMESIDGASDALNAMIDKMIEKAKKARSESESPKPESDPKPEPGKEA